MDTALPPTTHNNPPDPLIAEMEERIDAANRWLKERPDWEKWDAETADKANFFIGQIAATRKALDDRRLEEGREFKKKQDEFYKDPLALLDLAKGKLMPLRTAWLKREEDRVRAEKEAKEEAARKAAAEAEAARLKAEKAMKAKGGDPLRAELEAAKAAEKAAELQAEAESAPEKAQIKGNYSSRAAGLRDYWSAEVVDISAAFKFYNAKGNAKKERLALAIRAAIEKFADEDARELKDETKAPPGIKFVKERR